MRVSSQRIPVEEFESFNGRHARDQFSKTFFSQSWLEVCFEGPRVHLQDRRGQYGANTVKAKDYGRLWRKRSIMRPGGKWRLLGTDIQKERRSCSLFSFSAFVSERWVDFSFWTTIYLQFKLFVSFQRGGVKKLNHVVFFGQRWNVHSLFTWIMLMTLRIFGFERPLFVRNCPKHQVSAQISRQPSVTVETMSFRMCTSERSMARRRVERTGITSNRGWIRLEGRRAVAWHGRWRLLQSSQDQQQVSCDPWCIARLQRYKMKIRLGRGFTLEELRTAKVSPKRVRTIGVAVDQWRRNRGVESREVKCEPFEGVSLQVVDLSSRKQGEEWRHCSFWTWECGPE